MMWSISGKLKTKSNNFETFKTLLQSGFRPEAHFKGFLSFNPFNLTEIHFKAKIDKNSYGGDMLVRRFSQNSYFVDPSSVNTNTISRQTLITALTNIHIYIQTSYDN